MDNDTVEKQEGKSMAHENFCPCCGDAVKSSIFPFCEPCRIQLRQEADANTSDGGYLSYEERD